MKTQCTFLSALNMKGYIMVFFPQMKSFPSTKLNGTLWGNRLITSVSFLQGLSK